MGSSFNQQILMEKLAKLNPSQASIETKQVVETWDRQFHCSPREQRLAFLYLANDILQNSRRKGSEFVGEFWKVLPGALHNVIESGDEAGRNAALRLINIWEERKVFGSHGQTLKDEVMGKHSEISNRNGKHVLTNYIVELLFHSKQPAGSNLDKIISSYQVVQSGQVDEDVITNKCKSAISCFEKVLKGVDSHVDSEEMQGQHVILRDSINQLTNIEIWRAGLVSLLREALREEESKLEKVRNQVQAAQSQLENANKVCQQLAHSSNAKLLLAAEESSKDEQPSPALYTRQVSFPVKEEDPLKSTAADVAAKLTASTSSAQMLSYVLSSLASEGVIGNPPKESPSEYPSQKRAKLGQQLASNDPPPPPSPPPLPPPPPPVPTYSVRQYLQSAGPINAVQFGYNLSQQQPSSLTGYPGVGTQMTGIAPFTVTTSNSYQGYQGLDGNLYGQ